jgi:hypothetical protein
MFISAAASVCGILQHLSGIQLLLQLNNGESVDDSVNCVLNGCSVSFEVVYAYTFDIS